jgi:hypothetical protein
VLAPVIGIRQAVKQLDQVLDQHRHLVGTLTAGLGYRGRRLDRPDLKCLGTPAAFGDPELDALSRPEHGAGGHQGGRVHEDLTAIIAGEEAESLIGVIPLDLASRHEQTLCARRNRWATNLRFTSRLSVLARRPARPDRVSGTRTGSTGLASQP